MHVTHKLSVFADYFQFIVQDEAAKDDFSTVWTAEALDAGTAFGKSSVCPGTLRNVTVRVELHLCDSAPSIDLSTVDHAVEGSINLPSGIVVVMGCTGHFPDAPRFSVPPGTYRVLALMKGIQSVTAEWEPADDSYPVYLWPGEPTPPRLLKHWKSDA